MSAAVSRAQEDLVDGARRTVRSLVDLSKDWPDDARLAKAQMHLVAALAELVKYENDIGGVR